DALVALLHDRDAVDEFVAIERRGSAAELHRQHAGSRTRRDVDRHHIDLMLHRDVRRGRGSTRVRMSGAVSAPDMARLIDQATGRAARNLEPAWSLPPPAAPARVDVADPALPENLMDAAVAL